MVLEVKDGRTMAPTGESRVEATVPTSPSSVITAAQSYPSGFAFQHADAASMTKCSEVKSRAKRITDDADWLAKIERGRRIFERIRVRTDKVAKTA